MREENGYLTVYAALSMAVLLSLFLALLESARFHTIRLETALITDIAADSALAEYHREMLEQYGMFWIDTSYGSNEPSLQKVQEHIKGYMDKNCNMEDVFLGDYLYRDFLAMRTDDVRIPAVSVASDEGGAVFRSRAVEVVKEDVGLGILQRVTDWLSVIKGNKLDGDEPDARRKSIEEQLAALGGTQKQVGEDWITVEVINPARGAEEIRRKGILNFAVTEPEKISSVTIDPASLIGNRRQNAGLNRGNWEYEESETDVSLTDRLLWQEYLLRYCGYYGNGKEEGVLQYQIEYLIAGKNNDTDNLKSVTNRICAIREAANLMYLLSDEVKCAEVEAIAILLSTALTIPEAQELFEAGILLGWAYMESLYDVKHLFEGQKVPLLKSADTWYCDVDCVLDGIKETEEDGMSSANEGLEYRDYLRLLLALSHLEEQTFRMMDVVEMDIRSTSGNESFRLDGCIDRMLVEADISSAYGYSGTNRLIKAY